jgi:hypothetical protein
MAFLNVFEKKGFCPLGVRPWICVFLIYLIYLFIHMGNECAYRSDFLKYDFYYFYGHANFCLCTLYFQYHQHLGIFCTMLHNSSRSPIWYSMFQHEYKHKCELPHPRGLPNFL